MPVLFPSFARSWGDAVAGSRRGLGSRNARADEVWKRLPILDRSREPQVAFVTTMRGVIDPGGQTVSAMDRLYLAAHVPTLIVWRCDRDTHASPSPTPTRSTRRSRTADCAIMPGRGPRRSGGGAGPIRRDPRGVPARRRAQPHHARPGACTVPLRLATGRLHPETLQPRRATARGATRAGRGNARSSRPPSARSPVALGSWGRTGDGGGGAWG